MLIHDAERRPRHSCLQSAARALRLFAARTLGPGYLAIAEHSHPLAGARGRGPLPPARQCDQIGHLTLNSRHYAAETDQVDIVSGGSLDLSGDVLGRLGLVLGAAHSQFHLSPRARPSAFCARWMTPSFNVLAHPRV